MGRVNRFPVIEQELQMLQKMLTDTHDKSVYQRLRLLVLIATEQVHTQGQAASILCVHRNTIARWLTRYEQQDFEHYLSTESTGPKTQRTLCDEVYCALADRLNTPQGFDSFGHALSWVNELQLEHGHPQVEYMTLYQLIRAHFGGKLKAVRPIHPKKKWKNK